MNDEQYLAKAPIWRALAHLCIPMMAALSVNTIYSIVNAGFIGSLHSTALLAAITYGLPVIALVMAVGGVFGVGAGTAISRLLGGLEGGAGEAGDRAARADQRDRESVRGQRDPDDIKRFSAFALYGALITGMLVGGACLLALGPIISLLGATGPAVHPTKLYVGVQLAFTPVLTVAFALEQLVRAEGAARASMTGLILSTVANLIFDVLFILLLGWSVTGAALAIGLSNLVAVIYFARHLITRSTLQSLAPRWFALRPAIAKEVFGIGASELLQSGFLLASSLVMNHIATHYSENLLAGFGVAQRVVQFPEFLCMGVAMGVLPLFGFVYGRRDSARLRGALDRSAIAIAGLVLIFALPVFLARDEVMSIFTANHQLQQLGGKVLTAMLISALFNGFTGLFISLFQATAQGAAAIVMSVMQGVLFIPIVFAASATFGQTGVIWSMTVTEGIMLIVAAGLFAYKRRAILASAAAAAAAGAAASAGGGDSASAPKVDLAI